MLAQIGGIGLPRAHPARQRVHRGLRRCRPSSMTPSLCSDSGVRASISIGRG